MDPIVANIKITFEQFAVLRPNVMCIVILNHYLNINIFIIN